MRPGHLIVVGGKYFFIAAEASLHGGIFTFAFPPIGSEKRYCEITLDAGTGIESPLSQVDFTGDVIGSSETPILEEEKRFKIFTTSVSFNKGFTKKIVSEDGGEYDDQRIADYAQFCLNNIIPKRGVLYFQDLEVYHLQT